jgi:site-specific DNA-methyltransferase (adenine-specific)
MSSSEIEGLITDIAARHGRMRSERTRRAEIAIEQGKSLIAVKAMCAHGDFQRLIDARLPFSYSVAADYMKLARHGEKLGRGRARGSCSVRQALGLIEHRSRRFAQADFPEAAKDRLIAVANGGDFISPREGWCELILGDCMEHLAKIPEQSIDLILTDLPSGASGLEWDQPLDLTCLWPHYRRIIRPNHPIVLFATQPYATDLIVSNRGWFRYEWIWRKSHKTGFVHAKSKPLRQHENILVFSEGTTISANRSVRRMPFYPQGLFPVPEEQLRLKRFGDRRHSAGYRESCKGLHVWELTGYPSSVLEYPVDRPGLHPVAKPIKLLQFLIETYTRPGAVVLDNAMGAGSTGVACVLTGRRFIGIERDAKFYRVAEQVIGTFQRRRTA